MDSLSLFHLPLDNSPMTHLIFLTQLFSLYYLFFLLSALLLSHHYYWNIWSIFDEFSFSFSLSFEGFADLFGGFSFFFPLPQRVRRYIGFSFLFSSSFIETFDGFFSLPPSFREFTRYLMGSVYPRDISFLLSASYIRIILLSPLPSNLKILILHLLLNFLVKTIAEK